MNRPLLFYFLFFGSSVSAQKTETPTIPIKISGRVENIQFYCPNIPNIILFENKDTLLIASPDSEGNYAIKTSFCPGNEYSILLDVPLYNPIQIHSKTDTVLLPRTYNLDLKRINVKTDYFNPGFFFEFNSMEMITVGIDFVGIQCMLKNNPGLCLEFTYFIDPKENKTIVKKRLVQFKDQMQKAGVDMKRIVFYETYIYPADDPEFDMSSRFQAAIYSMEGNCFE